MQHLFNRNMQAREHLELLLVSAVSSVLLLRFYLHITGYPQVGGETLHIAHMLYGGIFMVAAIVLLIAFLGIRIERVAALVGGIGFGIFIDELGKFITKDNNYFFEPAIGLIYATFIVLYLSISFITRGTRYRQIEYQLNALRQFEEAVMHDMDTNEKQAVAALLARTDTNDPISRQLRRMLEGVATVHPAEQPLLTRVQNKAAARYRNFWQQRNSNRAVATLFAAQAVGFALALFGPLAANLDVFASILHAEGSYDSFLLMGQLVATVAATSLALIGIYTLTRSRVAALEWFRRATLVNLFLTEFFIFTRIEFGAMPGFIANLALLFAINAALSLEQQSAVRDRQ